MPGQQDPTDQFRILLVCTGNICRSALAERLGRAYLDDVLGDDAGLIRLSSAGTGAVVGSGMHPDSALVLAGLGGDPGAFAARQLQPEHAAGADLVLTMTRAHRHHVLQLAPRTLARTFTLREAADVLTLLGDVEADGDDLPSRARDLVRAMATGRSRHVGGEDDDVLDPINLPLEAHQEAGDLVAAALLPLLERFADLVADDPGVGVPFTDGVAGLVRPGR
ncbi:arsenate reductase/protein-tyrosine-phosphatase family protein [Geodermatophilus sp. SYSU D00815]